METEDLGVVVKKNKKKLIIGSVLFLGLLLCIILFNKIVNTVESGTYHIKQAAITGDMTAKMVPGMYGLVFGSYEVWPKSETYFFTADKDTEDDVEQDLSVQAQFNDGSIVRISGTARIVLPVTDEDAISVVTVSGYRSYESLRDKHVLPILRKALRNTASLMTAKESYATKRTDYQVWAADQLENGMYILEDKVRKVKIDETCIITKDTSCEMKDEKYKVIKRNSDGSFAREKNALLQGLSVLNLEVKSFEYDPKVKDQIATQQDAMMTVQTAIANTKKAEQEKIEQEALGKKAVAIAKYKELEEKEKAIVQAQRDKEVEELQAQKRKNVAELGGQERRNVAKLDKDAASFTKQKEILLGQGEAERKKLVMKADGALKQKLDAWVQAQKVWADAFAVRKVPAYVNYGAGGTGKQANGSDFQTQQFQSFMNVMMAKQLGLDLTIKE